MARTQQISHHSIGGLSRFFVVSLFAISSVFAAGERSSFDPTQFSALPTVLPSHAEIHKTQIPNGPTASS